MVKIINEKAVDGGFMFDFGIRQYRALELNLIGLGRLKVNLKVQQENKFHIDTLDLYIERMREKYISIAAERFQIDQEELRPEIYALIEKLDQKRVELLQDGEKKEMKPEMTDTEKEEALGFLRSPNLMDEISRDFERCGYIGEETSRLFGYVAMISRYLDKPLGLLIVSRSGAGKSELQDVLIRFVRPEQLRRYTRISGQSLFYQQAGDLKHSVLCIAEEKGAEDAIYSIRTLQSDQYLTVAVTTTDQKSGNKKVEEYRVEGPIVIMITTTNPDALDFETRNRFVMLTIDESREQTRRILQKQREEEGLEGLLSKTEEGDILKKHHNAQRLLRPLKVVNPYFRQLSYPDDKLLMRREQKKYLTLIKTITFLHQYQRDIRKIKSKSGDVIEYIEVTPEDIKLANTLAADVLGRSLQELSPHTLTLLKAIREMVQNRIENNGKHDIQFSRKELCAFTGWSYWQIHDHLKQLVVMEYLTMKRSNERNRYFYQLIWDGSGEDAMNFMSDIVDIKKPTIKKKRSV